MSDIVNELRTGRGITEGPMRDAWVHGKMQEAANEIKRLRTENEKLRTELWNIHALCNNYPHFFWWPVHRIKRRVRTALGGKDE